MSGDGGGGGGGGDKSVILVVKMVYNRCLCSATSITLGITVSWDLDVCHFHDKDNL